VLINEADRQKLTELFSKELNTPVRVLVFTVDVNDVSNGNSDCMYCKETVQLATEVGELSDKITVEVYDLYKDRDTAEEYGISRAPAIAIVGARDYGIRFYGIPAGYEFTAFVSALINVSKGVSGLSLNNIKRLGRIDKPVHIQVFVTPTCPYCAPAVQLAHKIALASDFIRADMVEAQEFPELATHYGVYGVPRTVINEDYHIEGAVPEDTFVLHVLAAAGKITKEQAALAGLV
jgi:glutaredoxin-like protein